jgi:hypothetical protein
MHPHDFTTRSELVLMSFLHPQSQMHSHKRPRLLLPARRSTSNFPMRWPARMKLMRDILLHAAPVLNLPHPLAHRGVPEALAELYVQFITHVFR